MEKEIRIYDKKKACMGMIEKKMQYMKAGKKW